MVSDFEGGMCRGSLVEAQGVTRTRLPSDNSENSDFAVDGIPQGYGSRLGRPSETTTGLPDLFLSCLTLSPVAEVLVTLVLHIVVTPNKLGRRVLQKGNQKGNRSHNSRRVRED